MKVPREIDPAETSMPWLPELAIGNLYQFRGQRPLYVWEVGRIVAVPGETKLIFECVQALDRKGTVLRGHLMTVAYRWDSADEVLLMARPVEQPDPRTGLGYLNPHECPVCGEMHYVD